MPYLPERRRHRALRRGARRGGRRRRPLRRRGRRRARRGRLRAARRRRRHPRGAGARRAVLLHPEAGTNVATDRTFSFGAGRRRLRGAPTTSCTASTRSRATPRCRWSATASSRSGATRPTGPAVEAGRTSTGRSRWCRWRPGRSACPVSRFRLHVPADIGGSFGIKSGIYPYVVLMALASKHAGRAGALDRGPRRAPAGQLVGRGAGDGVRGGRVPPTGPSTALRVDLVDDVGAYLRPPEPSTLYRCFGNITGAVRRPGGGDPGPRRRHQPRADRAQPRLRRPAALLRARAPDGRGRRADRARRRRGPAPQPRARVPAPHPHRRALRLRRLPGRAGPAARQGRVRRAARPAGERPGRGRVLRGRPRAGRRPVGHQHRLRRARDARVRAASRGGTSPARPRSCAPRWTCRAS